MPKDYEPAILFSKLSFIKEKEYDRVTVTEVGESNAGENYMICFYKHTVTIRPNLT